MQQFDVHVLCTVCGQALMLPAGDLRASFTCPRCGTTQAATQLVHPSVPLRAIPAVDAARIVAPSYPQAPLRQEHGHDARAGFGNTPQQEAQAPLQAQPHREALAHPPPAVARQPYAAPSAQPRPAAAQQPHAAPFAPQPQPHATQQPYAVPNAAPKRVAVAPLPSKKAAGVATAASIALALGRAAWWLDRVADGKRLVVLASLGFVVWVAREYVGGIGYVLTLLAYTSLLYLLLLARFWWVRDSDGDWTWSTFSTRARVAITDVAQTIFDAQERSWAGVLDELRSFLLAVG
jgi:hypothetical protein